MYEPELFPGLIYQTAHRGVVAHVFSSGRVSLKITAMYVCTGSWAIWVTFCLLRQGGGGGVPSLQLVLLHVRIC